MSLGTPMVAVAVAPQLVPMVKTAKMDGQSPTTAMALMTAALVVEVRPRPRERPPLATVRAVMLDTAEVVEAAVVPLPAQKIIAGLEMEAPAVKVAWAVKAVRA